LAENIAWHLAKKTPSEVALTVDSDIKRLFEKFFFSFSVKHFRALVDRFPETFSYYGLKLAIENNYSKMLNVSYTKIDDNVFKSVSTLTHRQNNPSFRAGVRSVVARLEKNNLMVNEYISWLKKHSRNVQERPGQHFFNLVSLYLSEKKDLNSDVFE